jgi:ribosome-binding ATPase YchF (GTP1/OBG family)
MNIKDYQRIEKGVRKYIKQNFAMKKKNKRLKKLVHSLQEEYKQLERKKNIPHVQPVQIQKEIVYVENGESICHAFIIVIVTFLFNQFLKSFQTEHQFDMDLVTYTMLTIHIVCMCLYYQYK